MTRSRVVENAKRYVVLINEDTLFEFKRVSYNANVKPTTMIRTMMDDHIERMNSKNPNRRLRIDVVYGIMDQVELLKDNKGKFKLNDLICLESMKFIKEIRSVNAAYLQGAVPKKYILSLCHREHVTLTIKHGLHTMKSTAHECVITVKGFFIYIQLPKDYLTSNDNYAKYCMINNLLITLTELTLEYRGQLMDTLIKLDDVPVLENS